MSTPLTVADPASVTAVAPPLQSATGRIQLIDGLRGLAALLVVCFHIYENLKDQVAQWLPAAIHWLLSQGYLGVAIFFVLSGYVISLNVGTQAITCKFVAGFALRRSIRLDPPYWGSIALAVLLTVVADRLFPELGKQLPSMAQLVSHLFYLQNILGYENIVPIYWTLCLEVQFYLFLLVILSMAQRSSSGTGAAGGAIGSTAFAFTATALSALSLAQFTDLIDWFPEGLFVPYWFSFSLGMFCVWASRGWIAHGWFLANWFIVLLAVAFGRGQATLVATAATAGLLHLAGHRGGLYSWSLGPVMQYLGRISYSLYLFHGIVGWSSVSLLKRLLPDVSSPTTAAAIFLAGIVVSVLCAQVAYSLIERPSIRFSHRFRLRSPE